VGRPVRAKTPASDGAAIGMQPQSTPPQSWQPAPAENPMAVHVKVIAIIEIVWGSLVGLAALIVLFLVTVASGITTAAGAPGFVAGIIASFGILIVLLLAPLAVLALLGGFRLLHLRRSGRTLTYVVAALSLLNFPLGTAFGVYAFIILTRPETDRLFAPA
jgi:hypothetical protein